jgi:hypothetical protein
MTNQTWTPAWARASHPITQRHLRQPFTTRYNYGILAVVLGLFLLLGGLSLPLMYLLFSLAVLLHISVGTVDKIQTERERFTWDLVRSAPFSPGEILLSIWASNIHQLNRTWIMWIYRVLQGLLVIGLMVFGMWFGEIPTEHWLVVLICGTLVIVLQPFADMYFSGMIALVCIHVIRDRTLAQGVAVGVVLVYWLLWLGAALVMLASGMEQLNAVQVATLFFVLPLALPTIVGYIAYRIAHKLMR